MTPQTPPGFKKEITPEQWADREVSPAVEASTPSLMSPEEDLRIIEEIQNLRLAEQESERPSHFVPVVPPLMEQQLEQLEQQPRHIEDPMIFQQLEQLEQQPRHIEDPMIFQPVYYDVPPQFVQEGEGEQQPGFFYPPEMGPVQWTPGPPTLLPAAPIMQQGMPEGELAPGQPLVGPNFAPPPVWTSETGSGIPSPVPLEMVQQPITYHPYPVFQPVPTFVGQPYFHQRKTVNGQVNNNNNNKGNTVRECYNCRRPGHLARNCGEIASDKQCFHCLKFGHVVRNCPQTRPQRRTDGGDPRLNGSVSSSPNYLEWSSDSGDPSSDCHDVSPSMGSPMPTEFGCFNPPDFDVNPANARFYIIKSNSESDIRASIENSIWCSTDHGNKKLDNAFKNHHHNGPTILLFSVNNSGKFCGIAEMVSRVDFSRESGVWSNNRFRGQFRVKWSHVKDVPNSALRHIYLANNDFKPVTFSRDTQEVPPREGKRMLYIMHKYQHVSSMLEPVVEAGSEGEDCNETGSLNLEEEDEERAWALAEGTGGEDGDGGGGEQQMFAPYPVYPFPQPNFAPYPAPFVPYHFMPYHPAGMPQPLMSTPPLGSPGDPPSPSADFAPSPQYMPAASAPLLTLPAIPQPLFMPTASPQPLFIPQLIDPASLPSSHSASPVHRQSHQPTSPPQPLLRHFPRPHPTSSSPQLQRQLLQRQPRPEVDSLEEFPNLPKKSSTITPLIPPMVS